MLSTWMPRAAGWRRIVVGLTLTLAALAVSVGPADAQAAAAPPAAPAAAPAQAAPPVARTLTGDVGLIVYIVKGDKATEFDGLIAKLKDVLAKSDKPQRKAQAAGWRILKSQAPLADGNVVYTFLIDPVVKDADYSLSAILYEGLPTETKAIYESIKSCVAAGTQYANYQLVGNLGK